MAQFPGITLTNVGLNMIAESQASSTALIFTNLKMGDGTVSSGEDIKILTAVKNPLLTVPIESHTNQGDGQVKLRFAISNGTLTTGFFARELGIYAKIGESGTEQLYAYTNARNLTDYIPDKNTPIDEQIIDIYLIVGNASSVKVVTDGSIMYATNADLEDHNASATAHQDIREALKKAGALPLGTVLPWLMKSAPAGWLALDTGALVSRTTYAELWAWVQANAPLISETDWQTQSASQTSVGAYSTGDGSTTFRLPRILDYVRGGLQSEVGMWQSDAIRNITATLFAKGIESVTASGANSFVATNWQGWGHYGTGVAGNIAGTATFDASTVVPTASENRPKTIKMLYCVKAFDAETNQGLIDITALANDTAAKVNKTDYVADFAKSLASNGYQKLPSGLIIQWGTASTASGTGYVDVTFPIAFPTACLNVLTSDYKNVVGTTAFGAGSPNTTTVRVYGYQTSSGDSFYWLALGY